MKKKVAAPAGAPADSAGFENFKTELVRLVARFEQNFKLYQSPTYSEASVRQDFLDPLFAALGWDIGNKRGLIPQHREVEIESRTEISGRQKRADYLFRTDRADRFVCEAKKPAETLHAGHAFQAKRYAWNKNLVLAILSDFEEIKIYLVGARPHADDPDTGHLQTWHYLEYVQRAADIWNLLSRDAVAAGSIEKLVASLPRQPAGKTRRKQMWLFKPDRARAIDADFLDFLDEARRELASDLIRHNDRADLLEGTRLDEAVQRILDRLLFLRICEDRDIDTGRPLANILKSWRDRAENPPPRKLRAPALPLHEAAAEYAATPKPAPPESLWREIVAHFRALDRRPASHIPYFNGNLFKEHFSETLAVSDGWISGFLEEIGDDESPYLFNVIPVEILGTIYERFLGKTVRPHGRGVTIEEKPEVRKAGGVYYTPRYIVDYIVEQTLGKLLADKAPADSLKLRVLDPACGSGSFLIRAYERLCEHWQTALTKDEKLRRKADCWTDPDTGDLHLTTDLKRRILTASIYGVDLDPGAVEVTQLSLYLKMLEGESRATLARNRELFGPDAPLLPPLQNNVKCGNSLIASDFSLNPDDLVRVRAFDWDVQFKNIMQNGGFDAVIGNPPWGADLTDEIRSYLSAKSPAVADFESAQYFLAKSSEILDSSGLLGVIIPNTFALNVNAKKMRNAMLLRHNLLKILELSDVDVFLGPNVRSLVAIFSNNDNADCHVFRSGANFSTADLVQVVSQSELKAAETWKGFLTKETPISKLVVRLSGDLPPLAEYCDVRQGYIPYRTTTLTRRFGKERAAEIVKKRLWHAELKRDDSYQKELQGSDVGRYLINWSGVWVHYGEWVSTYLPITFFSGLRVLIREITGRPPHALMAVCTDDIYVHNPSVLAVIPKHGMLHPKFVTAIINSRLMSQIFTVVAPKAEKGLFPKIIITDARRLPFPRIDLKNSSSRAHHDKLVALVDKMLLLVPKLRAAKSEGDRATLQNAVAATDRAIDALVYELYGLTPEEIALVEGAPTA